MYKGCQVLEDSVLVADIVSKSKLNSTKLLGAKSYLINEVTKSWLQTLEALHRDLLGKGDDSSDSDGEETREVWLPYKVTDKARIISKPTSAKEISKMIIKPIVASWIPKPAKTYNIVMVEADHAGHGGTAKGGSSTSPKNIMGIAVARAIKKAHRMVLTNAIVPPATKGIWSLVRFLPHLDLELKKSGIEEVYTLAASNIRLAAFESISVQTCETL